MRFELTTFSLATKRSTPELHLQLKEFNLTIQFWQVVNLKQNFQLVVL